VQLSNAAAVPLLQRLASRLQASLLACTTQDHSGSKNLKDRPPAGSSMSCPL